ncbi:glycoside hydrolase family 72 protein [Acrodontium crateriforme]|uniref:1,3-beta-glucanosyltransferase n=1 Tax=Acrodontium crateriforme TaxID=150365 RepID=A0AAQ3M7R4_9PEZI|nr:glycoside hydrolase family 72 protein [Acrodontium crateriforme]
MKAAFAIAAAAAATLVGATPTNIQARSSGTSSGSLPVVTVKGNAFFAGDERFYIRGVDYQPGGSSDTADPIANVANCKRDVAEFKKLGINTVRVYTIDNTANHDECMSMLADAGIYLALDVNTPKYSIRRDQPAQSYNPTYLQSLFATIDEFQKYDNTLLFFSGNEVINADNNTDCAPYIKAVTRDMKAYINSRNYRKIPVGYSAADVESNRYELADYLNCGPDYMRSDFFAFNDYSWCDPSSMSISGWDQKVQKFSNYSIPLFLSEYGCNTNKRTFGAVAAIYGSQMTPVYSGGLVYEYVNEANNYGLVTVDGSQLTELPDFSALMKAYQGTQNPSGDGGYKSSGQVSTCPTESETWQVKDFTNMDLPAMPSGAQQYMKNGAGTGPGLTGSGSQEAGGQSTTTATPGSGSSSSDSSNSSTSASAGAASSVHMGEMSMAPLVCAGIVTFFTLVGTTLL